MADTDFTALIAWQRADELEKFVVEMLKHPGLAREAEFCAHARDAARLATRNIADGFDGFGHSQFAGRLRIAIDSEMQTRAHIVSAWQRDALTDSQKSAGLLLCRRAVASAVCLRLDLESPEATARIR